MKENFNYMKKLFCEFLGTTMIVLVSCFSFKAYEFNKISSVGLGLCNGLVLTILSYAFYSKCESHFNPAISLAYLVVLKKPAKICLFYILTQLLASIFASFLVLLLTLPEF